MFCPNCGTQLPDNAAFCGNCGTQIAQVYPQPQYNTQGQQTTFNVDLDGHIVMWQVILAVLVPVFGWIAGGIQLGRGTNVKNGKALLIAATISFLFYWLMVD